MEQKILVTGASGGFGFLISQTLVNQGHKVVGTMRSTAGKNEKTAQELIAAGVQLIEMDVTIEDSVYEGVKSAIELLGGLDTVINNAGIGAMGIQELFTAEDMQKVFNVNVFGVQTIMRAVLPYFRSEGKGSFVYISSCLGRITFPFYGIYNASKWALEALVENYRTELSGFGIESYIIEPGGMPTDFFDALLKPNDAERETTYGDFKFAPQASFEGFNEALQNNPKQRPQKVADAVSELIEMPFGEKPFRTIVDFMGMKEPIEQYNNLLHETTNEIYTGFGIEGMLSLNKN